MTCDALAKKLRNQLNEWTGISINTAIKPQKIVTWIGTMCSNLKFTSPYWFNILPHVSEFHIEYA